MLSVFSLRAKLLYKDGFSKDNLMKLHTASEVITFAKQLENESAKFYDFFSERFNKEKDNPFHFSKENSENISKIERAYYGVISDAIEGCFAFDIEIDKYQFEIAPPANITYLNAIETAIDVEEKMIKFYSEAIEHSKSLLADVPRTFAMIVNKRKNRQATLKNLLTAQLAGDH